MRLRNRTVLRIVAAALGVVTAVMWISYLVERHELKAGAKAMLAARRDALEARFAVLVEATARRLQAMGDADFREAEGVYPVLVNERTTEPMLGLPVGDGEIYTGILEEEKPSLVVGVEKERGVWLYSRVPLPLIEDALREVWPGKKGRVYLTTMGGRPVLEVRQPKKPEPGAGPKRPRSEHQKVRPSSDALDAISQGERAEGTYKNLDDRDAVGAWCRSEAFHGGLLVEQEQRVAFADVRGLQSWHVAAALLVIALLVIAATALVPKARFTADLLRLYVYARRYWFLIGLTIGFMGLFAGGNMLRLVLFKRVVEDVLMGKGEGAIAALWQIISWYAVIIVVMAGASWLKEYLSGYVTQAIVNDLRVKVASHLVTLEMHFFDKKKAGELMSRLSNDVNSTRKSLTLLFGEFFQEPLMLVGALGAALYTNWRLSVMLFLGMPLIVLPISRLGRMVKKYAKRRQVQRGVVTEVLMQTISGIRTVKSFQMEDHETERLRSASQRLLTQSVRVTRTVALSRTFVELMNSIGGLLILAIGGYMVIHAVAGATAGDLMTLAVIMSQSYKPVKDLTKTYNKIQDSLAGAERIFEIMDRPPEMADRPDAVSLERPEKEIAFEHVTFAYDEQPVLRDISFRVKVGEVAALVGETGAGKSTVTDLIPRFYDPDEGRITIDGRDLRDYRSRSIRRCIATVTQDAFLFNAKIRDNILYGNPGATDEEVVEAAKAAGIHDEIEKMERGYNTRVGERGTRLSGGQIQRLTIARAILKDAPILVLDEATSALDSQTEAIVQEALDRLMQGRTTFVIAHRLSTIAHADRILVLMDGELVEQGTHEELMAKEDGVYQSLHRIQFATAEGGA